MGFSKSILGVGLGQTDTPGIHPRLCYNIAAMK